MSDLAILKPAEAEMLAEIDRSITQRADIIIPDDVSPKRLLEVVEGLTSIIAQSELRSNVAVPLLGCALKRMAHDREALSLAGYTKIGDYVKKCIAPFISASAAYAAAAIYSKMPSLTLEEYAEVGKRKLTMIADVLPKNPSPTQVQKLVEAGKGCTEREMREFIEEAGYAAKGELAGASYILSGAQIDVDRLRSFLKDPVVRAAVESHDPLKMILAAFEESMVTWEQQVPGVSHTRPTAPSEATEEEWF